jgi:antitoxin (DNA-binding transcriptional repressor) of toxin-antitoxin stability system
MGWIDTGSESPSAPYASPQRPPSGAFLPDTRAGLRVAGDEDAGSGSIVTVTNHGGAVAAITATSIQPYAYGEPLSSAVMTTPSPFGVGPGQTWVVADTFTDASGGQTIQVSSKTYLHGTRTASESLSEQPCAGQLACGPEVAGALP